MGSGGYRRPVLDAKGKIIPDMLIVNGLEERHAEGTYCICFYNPKLTWQKCGRKPMDAVAAAERQRALFKAMEHGIVQRPTKTQIAGTMDEAVSEFTSAELEARVGNGSKRPRTYDLAFQRNACGNSKRTLNGVARRVCQDHQA